MPLTSTAPSSRAVCHWRLHWRSADQYRWHWLAGSTADAVISPPAATNCIWRRTSIAGTRIPATPPHCRGRRLISSATLACSPLLKHIGPENAVNHQSREAARGLALPLPPTGGAVHGTPRSGSARAAHPRPRGLAAHTEIAGPRDSHLAAAGLDAARDDMKAAAARVSPPHGDWGCSISRAVDRGSPRPGTTRRRSSGRPRRPQVPDAVGLRAIGEASPGFAMGPTGWAGIPLIESLLPRPPRRSPPPSPTRWPEGAAVRDAIAAEG